MPRHTNSLSGMILIRLFQIVFLSAIGEKCDNIVRLAEDKPPAALGLTVSKRTAHCILLSLPRSRISFQNELVYTGEAIDEFLEGLKEYIKVSEYRGVELTLPPNVSRHGMPKQ